MQMTPDGRYVVFVANVTGRSGTNTAIYRWDAQSGTTALVSETITNTLPPPAFCDLPSVSADGNHIAFLSDATGLTTNLLTSGYHLYLRNMLTGTTYLLDVSTNGTGSGVDETSGPMLSADGSFAVFESAQSDLTAFDLNRGNDVFLHYADLGVSELVSGRHPSLPCISQKGFLMNAVQPLSRDGRYVVFASIAGNIIAGDTNRMPDIFMRDLFTGINVISSVSSAGVIGNGGASEPAISGDGRCVVFTSSASNLVANDTNRFYDVFVRDLQSETTSLISVNSGGVGIGNNESYSPVVNADGRLVLFLSKAKNLTAGTFSGTDNLFVRDRQLNLTYALTTAGHAYSSMTPDGHFVAFTDTAGSGSGKIYVWDSFLGARVATNDATSTITRLAISPDGNRVAYYASTGTAALRVWDRPSHETLLIKSGFPASATGLRFSADARTLVYSIRDINQDQVYLHDLLANSSQLVSHSYWSLSAPADGSSDSPDVNADGRFVLYRSSSTDIVPGDANAVPDVFLYDTITGTNLLLSVSTWGKVSANNRSHNPAFSGDGRSLIFQSSASDLTADDFNQANDIFGFALLYADIDAGDGSRTISWTINSGESYTVEFKDELTDPEWHTVSASVMISGNRASLIDTTLDSGHRFYRIKAIR